MMDVSICNLPVTGGRLQQYQKAQESDPVCAQVRRYCMEGWPDEKKKISSELSQYWKVRSHLVVCQDGLLLFGSRIVVPKSLQRETLDRIHDGHQGVQRCRLRAKISVWWPGISREIENTVKDCSVCARNFFPRRERMISSELPQYPWQKIGVDLFHQKGNDYP